MSGKNQYPFTFSWQSNDPRTNFRPVPSLYGGGSAPSGALTGAMSGTNIIYSNIIEVGRMDNIGQEVSWTGTPAGSFQFLVSNSGSTFSALTFSPLLPAPAGTAGFFTVDLNQCPYKYLMVIYVNSSGTGVLSITGQSKDLN